MEIRFILKGLSENTEERINNMLFWHRVKKDSSVLIAPTEESFLMFISQLPYSVQVERLELKESDDDRNADL